MKRISILFLLLALLLTGCQNGKQDPQIPDGEQAPATDTSASADETPARIAEAPTADVSIVLSDDGITVDGLPVSNDETQAVYAASDIVYYPTGQDFTFGEGTEEDAHEASEADGHTVVHITQPGVYAISGKLSAGQIAVDLGEDAEEDPNAVVTLLLDNADITCTVAPAVIFYRVYECGDTENPSAEVDTSDAGANVFLADGSVNNIAGAYVARIYKAESVELSEDGTEVADAKKLHKYDAAFYSKMSMNVDGNDGILNILAENEGLDSELHLTVNGGDIRIESGNDGINTNEDGVSVTTINGGSLDILVNGSTGEGDGIDSNGWLVINGGSVTAAGCGFSGDAGIDSDMGIYLNGGSVRASGHMLDRIAGGDLIYGVFTFAETQTGGNTYTLKNADGEAVIGAAPANEFSILILAGDALTQGDYTFWCGETQLAASVGQGMGGMMRPGGQMPEGGVMPEMPEGMEAPEGMAPPEGMEFPEGMEPPEGMEIPEGVEPPEGIELPEGMEIPEGGFDGKGRPGGMEPTGEQSDVFTLSPGGCYFSGVSKL